MRLNLKKTDPQTRYQDDQLLGSVSKASESPWWAFFLLAEAAKMFCERVVGRSFKDLCGLSMTRINRIACASCQQCLW